MDLRKVFVPLGKMIVKYCSMKKRVLVLGAACLTFGLGFSAVPQEITSLFNDGEFRKVEEKISAKDSGLTAVEADSVRAIMNRIKADFRYTYDEGIGKIQERFPHATADNIKDWEARNFIETKIIDGQKMMYRKAISNLDRLVPELSANRKIEANMNALKRAKFLTELIGGISSETGLDGGHRFTIKYTIDVDADSIPAGKKIRVWMPYPIVSDRQKNVTLLSSSDKVKFSDSDKHNTVYMERKAKKGQSAHFEIVYSYDVYSKYYNQDYLLRNLLPYDKSSETYLKYTAQDAPQILLNDEMKSLALHIVGNETNPVKQASLIYNWIDAYFPWAGAREYSTIPNLAEYVLNRGYGDCGQVTLLYINLLRNIGIPARWESGWYLEPEELGIHDWAETYFEGIGWVPTDMSFGRNLASKNGDVVDFYKTGMDYHRLAANKGVCGKFSPEKKFIRSETVDSQLGEIEYDGENLFYYKGWTPKLEIVSVEELR